MGHFDSYVICTSPRSGSTLLCKLLSATSIAGVPESYFHRPSVSSWMSTFNVSAVANASEQCVLESVVKAAIAQGSGNTGTFGLRLQRHSAHFLIEKLGVLYPACSTEADLFKAAFGKTAFVYLTRQDKVEQAVSLVKAEQTGLWHLSADGTELERQSAPQKPVYDAASIKDSVEELSQYDQQWQQWFATQNIRPIRIDYEALSQHPIGTLRRALDYLGLDRRAALGVKPAVAKLADNVNHEWTARFYSEYSDFLTVLTGQRSL